MLKIFDSQSFFLGNPNRVNAKIQFCKLWHYQFIMHKALFVTLCS